jgi:5-formyltetrahydrofolate cyclo-ligase
VTPNPAVAAAKRELRATALAARRALDPVTVQVAAERLADNVAALVAQRGVHCAGAYVSLPDEPGTQPLLGRLFDAGVRVLLPVLLADRELDWGHYRPDGLDTGPYGILQPTSAVRGACRVPGSRRVTGR